MVVDADDRRARSVFGFWLPACRSPIPAARRHIFRRAQAAVHARLRTRRCRRRSWAGLLEAARGRPSARRKARRVRPLLHPRARAQELAGVDRVVRGYQRRRAWGLLSPHRRVFAYRIQKLRNRHQDWFREDFRTLLELLRREEIHPVVAERLPLSDARRAHVMLERSAAAEKSCSCHKPRKGLPPRLRQP